MRGAFVVLLQILVVGVGIAAIGGLIGFTVIHFAHWGGASTGFGWGMIVAGGLAAFLGGSSGSPSENLARGRTGSFFTYWGQSAAQPMTPLQIVIGGFLAFAGGIAMFFLVH